MTMDAEISMMDGESFDTEGTEDMIEDSQDQSMRDDSADSNDNKSVGKPDNDTKVLSKKRKSKSTSEPPPKEIVQPVVKTEEPSPKKRKVDDSVDQMFL